MEFYDTELWEAVQVRNIKRIQELLNLGADVNSSDMGTDPSLLYRSISSGDLEIAQILLSAGADVNSADEDRYTVLMRATQLGHLEAVRLLVNAGANVNIVNKDGGTAMSMAAWAGEQHIVEYLSSFCSSEEREYAAQVLPLGIRKKQRREDKFTTAFIEAVYSSNFEAIQTAIANGVNVNAFSEQGETALYIAAQRGDVETIRILLQAGADCEIRDENNEWTPLMEAARSGEVEIITTLIDAGADVNAKTEKDGFTALMIAIACHVPNLPSFGFPTKAQPLPTVQLLIERGADLEAQDKFGNTALAIATVRDTTDIVEILTKAGASAVGLEKANFLKAAERGNTDIVRYLLDAGVEVNAVDYAGKTALILASDRGHIDTVRFLIEAGADININHSGTALTAAADGGHLEIVQMLIQSGANVNLKDPHSGSNAVDMALYRYPKIVELLQKAGAKSSGDG